MIEACRSGKAENRYGLSAIRSTSRTPERPQGGAPPSRAPWDCPGVALTKGAVLEGPRAEEFDESPVVGPEQRHAELSGGHLPVDRVPGCPLLAEKRQQLLTTDSAHRSQGVLPHLKFYGVHSDDRGCLCSGTEGCHLSRGASERTRANSSRRRPGRGRYGRTYCLPHRSTRSVPQQGHRCGASGRPLIHRR